MKKLIAILIIAGVLFVLTCGLFLLRLSRPPNENLIGIINVGSQPIYNLTITIRDYSENIVEIPSEEMRNVALPDLGFEERDIRLVYTVNGESKTWSGGYRESNYCAYITIDHNNFVSIRHLNFLDCPLF